MLLTQITAVAFGLIFLVSVKQFTECCDVALKALAQPTGPSLNVNNRLAFNIYIT
jgi:hypothetical protein